MNGNDLMKDGDKAATLVEQRAIFHRHEEPLPVGNYQNTTLTSISVKPGHCNIRSP